MKYLLLIMLNWNVPPVQVGPFDSIWACEKAAEQVEMMSRYKNIVRTTCVGTNTKEVHWNGKGIK